MSCFASNLLDHNFAMEHIEYRFIEIGHQNAVRVDEKDSILGLTEVEWFAIAVVLILALATVIQARLIP